MLHFRVSNQHRSEPVLLLCDYYAAVISVAVVDVRADLVERLAALGLLLLERWKRWAGLPSSATEDKIAAQLPLVIRGVPGLLPHGAVGDGSVHSWPDRGGIRGRILPCSPQRLRLLRGHHI